MFNLKNLLMVNFDMYFLPCWSRWYCIGAQTSFVGRLRSGTFEISFCFRLHWGPHNIHCSTHPIYIPVGIYLLEVRNRNTRKRCEICSKLTIRTPKRRHWLPSGVFIVNFEHISHFLLVFLFLTLSMELPAGIDIV